MVQGELFTKQHYPVKFNSCMKYIWKPVVKLYLMTESGQNQEV